MSADVLTPSPEQVIQSQSTEAAPVTSVVSHEQQMAREAATVVIEQANEPGDAREALEQLAQLDETQTATPTVGELPVPTQEAVAKGVAPIEQSQVQTSELSADPRYAQIKRELITAYVAQKTGEDLKDVPFAEVLSKYFESMDTTEATIRAEQAAFGNDRLIQEYAARYPGDYQKYQAESPPKPVAETTKVPTHGSETAQTPESDQIPFAPELSQDPLYHQQVESAFRTYLQQVTGQDTSTMNTQELNALFSSLPQDQEHLEAQKAAFGKDAMQKEYALKHPDRAKHYLLDEPPAAEASDDGAQNTEEVDPEAQAKDAKITEMINAQPDPQDAQLILQHVVWSESNFRDDKAKFRDAVNRYKQSRDPKYKALGYDLQIAVYQRMIARDQQVIDATQRRATDKGKELTDAEKAKIAKLQAQIDSRKGNISHEQQMRSTYAQIDRKIKITTPDGKDVPDIQGRPTYKIEKADPENQLANAAAFLGLTKEQFDKDPIGSIHEMVVSKVLDKDGAGKQAIIDKFKGISEEWGSEIKKVLDEAGRKPFDLKWLLAFVKYIGITSAYKLMDKATQAVTPGAGNMGAR